MFIFIRKFIKYLLAFTILLSFITGCSKYKYPPGKDTEAIFGDGTLQIVIIYSSEDNHYYVFMNSETQLNIERDVYKYKSINDKIYIIGKNGYTVADSKTYEYQQCKDYSCFSENDKKVFEEHGDFTVLIER